VLGNYLAGFEKDALKLSEAVNLTDMGSGVEDRHEGREKQTFDR
jgi:hypothetical protein